MIRGRVVFYLTIIALLFVMFTNSFLFASRPDITISATTITPRLSMIEKQESASWRFWIGYKQSINSRLKTESYFEYGSGNDHFQNSLRVHSLTAEINSGNHLLKFGRIPLWNSLVQTRVDGMEYSFQHNKFGSYKILGGFPAVTDFSNTSFGENKFFLSSWSLNKKGKNIQINYWAESSKTDTVSYVGSTWNSTIFSKIRISTTLAWSLNANKLYHGRLYLTRKVGKHSVSFGVRKKRFNSATQFPWVKKEINLPPTISIGVRTSFTHRISIWNKYSYRRGNDATQYVQTTLLYNYYQITALAGISGEQSLFGGGIGARKNLLKNLSLGGSIMVNAVDYGDLVELQTATGIYGWLTWQIKSMISMRLFGQYYNNAYYSLDGRFGFVINVAY